MFEISAFLPVKGKSINIRGENHGEERVPALDWAVTADVMNEWLSFLDPQLKGMFYRPVETTDPAADRPQLEGVDLAAPVLRSTNVKFPLPLTLEFVGYQLTVDRGLGGKSNIVLQECKVNNFKINCKEGGSVELSFRIQASNVSEEVRGRLSSYIKGAVTAIALKPPEMSQEPIDGTNAAFQKDIGSASQDPDGGWPFPGGPNGAGKPKAPAKKKPATTEAGEAFAAAHSKAKGKVKA